MHEPWAGSDLSIARAFDNGGTAVAAPDMSVVIFLIVIALALLALFPRFASALGASAAMTVSSNRAKEVLMDNYSCISIVTCYLFAIPFFALIFPVEGLTQFNYWSTLLVISAFFAFRHLAFFIFRWLSGRKECVSSLEKLSCGAWFLVMAFSCLIMVFSYLIPGIGADFVRGYVGLMVVAGLVLYGTRGYRIIISSGFSGFFWILYLCALEVLPLCVAVNVVVS